MGTLTLQVPKVREGGYVPTFIEHRKRSEQALISVIQEAVVQGVSTRKIERVLEEFGIAGVSAGQAEPALRLAGREGEATASSGSTSSHSSSSSRTNGGTR